MYTVVIVMFWPERRSARMHETGITREQSLVESLP